MSELGRRVEELLADAGPLAAGKPGYSKREQQVALARAVAETLQAKGVLLADAPTGTS